MTRTLTDDEWATIRMALLIASALSAKTADKHDFGTKEYEQLVESATDCLNLAEKLK